MAQRSLIKFSVFVLGAALSMTALASATCPLEGLHVSGGGTVSTPGGRATLFQQNSSGCFIYVTFIHAKIQKVSGSNTATATLQVYPNTTCTTPSYSLSGLATVSGFGNKDEWIFSGSSQGAQLYKIGSDLCVGFDVGAPGTIESISWTGYFSGNP